ncbi:MAG: protocatechuate 3,4-dioxygenase subunit alpha [Ktedonobacteraceae bacterium]
MSALLLTASQTVGPFFSPALWREDACRNVLTQPETAGERIRLEGRILDGDGVPVPDAMVEIWQANAHGRYNHAADQGPAPLDSSFTGFGRSGTGDDGSYWFETIKPGPVPFKAVAEPAQHPAWLRQAQPLLYTNDEYQAPHICVTVFARGLLNHLVTRLYFPDEPANAGDAVLQCVPSERRATLLARCEQGSVPVVYRFDIILQGAGETVFFNL